MKRRRLLGFLLFFMLIQPAIAQEGFVHGRSAGYVWPEDSKVREKLDRWQDLKFGVILHWGLYAVPGIVESWSICSEDEDWIPRDSALAYEEYKKWYWGLIDQFNPTRFDPEQWAKVCKAGGMKYVIFTTKHHDGFNMFDTRQTDFSIAHGAFRNDPRKDVARHVFQAYRDQGFMVGTYFSKPDWHSEYYWWPRYATPNRNVNYKIDRHPQRWAAFQEFTFNQIRELMTNYGTIDILWLDGGWVSPASRQDIKMDKIAAMARRAQPGLIMVDRTIQGKYENYQTPERSIPEKQLSYPWESCITLGVDWGWTPHARFKSSRQVVNTLIEIVAKGGCLLLGVGPTPEGLIQPEVVQRLEVVGTWLKKNGEAIYNTRITKHYQDGPIWFTAAKDRHTLYAVYALPEGEELPATLEWTGNVPMKGSKMVLLSTGEPLEWSSTGQQVTVKLPATVRERKEPIAVKFTVR